VDDLLTIALVVVGGPVWWFIGLTISAVTFLGHLGRREASWPLIDAETPGGRVAALLFHGTFVAVILAGFVLSLSQ